MQFSLLDSPMFLRIFEGAREARGDPAIPLRYVAEALRRFEEGQLDIPRYPSGKPTLKGLYDSANALMAAT